MAPEFEVCFRGSDRVERWPDGNLQMTQRRVVTSVCTCAAIWFSVGVVADTPPIFDPEVIKKHIEYLASDALGGRGVDSKGIDLAADYLVEQFKAAGLEPAGEDGGWFQSFPVRNQKRLSRSAAELASPTLSKPLELGIDWTPLPYTAIGDAEGPVVFAGYGIEAPQHSYDDYFDIDPKDKIVLIFRYEPRSADPDAAFGGTEPSDSSTFEKKAETAARLGAKAMLVVNPPTHPRLPSDDLIVFEPWLTRPTYDIPMAQISRAAAEELVTAGGLPDLQTLQDSLEKTHESYSGDLHGVTIALKTGVSQASGKNVLGLLKGAGSTDETIVVTAHYDHLGVRPFGSGDERKPTIHNGADDNASGTTGIIELARAFAAGARPRRNILFVGFSAEESGLIGSRYFVEHPTRPIESLLVNVNFDMIGRYRPDEFEISGVGSATEFAGILSKHRAPCEIKFKELKTVRRDSDQASFNRVNIPSLFFFTGMHDEYHRPGDDTPLVDFAGEAKVLEFGYRVIRDLAELEAGPARIPDESDDEAGGPVAAASSQPSRPRVRLGIMPALEQDLGVGLKIESVTSGMAAANAGILSGDRILKIGDNPISTLDTLMSAMAGYRWGDKAQVVLKRGESEQNLTVHFLRPKGAADPS